MGQTLKIPIPSNCELFLVTSSPPASSSGEQSLSSDFTFQKITAMFGPIKFDISITVTETESCRKNARLEEILRMSD